MEFQLLSQPCVNDHSLVKPSLLCRNSTIPCTNCSFPGFSIYHYSHTTFIRRFFCKQMKRFYNIFFVFSVYLTVKRYSAHTEFALKSVIVYMEITTVPVQTESNLGHGLFNYQKMLWQIKIANSFHFVTVTSHIRKTKEVWQKASASRWLHSLIHNIPYNTLRLTQFLLTPPLY